ncbi:MAG: hypothetical protein GX766_03930 [Firmicutes bacterium]|jgi:hypothetical protein|nr:hypothetical protein [Bacillota bacterium]
MFSIKNVLQCLLWNLRMLRRNPRLIMGLFMGFLICFLLTEKTISLTNEFPTDIQVFEPFIWCFADSDSILFASLALILLLSQFPRLDTPAAYLVFRTNRLNWLLGQVLTAFVISIGYTLFLLISTVILTSGNAYFENRWSDTATLLSFSPASFEVALIVVRKTIKLTTPWSATIHIFFLIAQYTLLLTTLNLAVSLRYGKKAGMFAIIFMSLLAYLLTPDRFMNWLQLSENIRYYANVLAAWLSPLQQSTFIMHNFGYDQLPTITQSHLIFGSINTALTAVSFYSVQKVQFSFTGGSPNG